MLLPGRWQTARRLSARLTAGRPGRPGRHDGQQREQADGQHGRADAQHDSVGLDPSGSNRRTGPTGASGDSATAPATASTMPPMMAMTPGRLAASVACARVAPSTRATEMSRADLLSSGKKPDRLRPDRLLHLAVDHICPVDIKRERRQPLADADRAATPG